MNDAVAAPPQEYRVIPLSERPPRHPRNRREGDVGAIVELIRVNGFVGAAIVQESTGYCVAGNHRTDAMELVGREIEDARQQERPEDPEAAERWESWREWESKFGPADVLPVIVRSMDDATAERHLIADNVASDLASWDKAALADDLTVLLDETGTLVGTGFDADDLDAMLRDINANDDAGRVTANEASLLARTDVSVADPTHEAERGKVYRLGDRHVLCVVDLMLDWRQWVEYLTAFDVDETQPIFVPYPGPFIALAERAERQPLVMVQPDPFVAGHILDKWVAVQGEGSYEEVLPE